jgi:uncharacterized membrane protein YgcG
MPSPKPPPPSDEPRFHTDDELALELPVALLDWVRRAAVAPPKAAPINHSAAYRPLPAVATTAYYDNYHLPGAIRVQLAGGVAGARAVALRRGSRKGSVELEAAAFELLADVGIPVPAILAGPSSDIPGEPECCLLVSELPGLNLQKLSMLPPLSGGLTEGGHAAGLFGQALDRLLESSAACQAHSLAVRFPTLSLADELRLVEGEDDAKGWMMDDRFARGYDALARLLAAGAGAGTDAAVSGTGWSVGEGVEEQAGVCTGQYMALYGDLQPANFLAVRAGAGAAGRAGAGRGGGRGGGRGPGGGRGGGAGGGGGGSSGGWELSGFVDFEEVAFRDVLLGCKSDSSRLS